jgi:long-subunit fatty acid transport protein
MTIALGFAWRATPQLSIGAGFAALIKSKLPLTADFPILEPDPMDPSGYRPVGFSLGIGMGAMLAPRLGVLYMPSPRLRIGAAYRGALYHDLDVDAYITEADHRDSVRCASIHPVVLARQSRQVQAATPDLTLAAGVAPLGELRNT